ncbi:MAG: hypothetical protein ACLQQ4_01525 [Bacteroidia bacterium]
MKNTLLFLLFIPLSLFSQSSSEDAPQQPSFSQVEYIDIGKAPVPGSLIRMDISIEIVKNMFTSTKTDSVCINWPGQNYHVFLTIDGNDVDTVISAVTKMFEETYSTPKNNTLTSYKCTNGFEFKVLWDGNAWTTSLDNYISNTAPLKIDVSDIPAFITLLKQAKAKFEK